MWKEKLRVLSSIRDQRTKQQGSKGTAKKLWNDGGLIIPADTLVDI